MRIINSFFRITGISYIINSIIKFSGIVFLIFLLTFQPLNAQFKKLYEFRADNNNNIKFPYYTQLLVVDSVFYGVTNEGGAYNKGTIFKINPDGTGFKRLYEFDITNGSNPSGSLIFVDSSIYGLTSSGGFNGQGVIFKIDTNGQGFQRLYNFIFSSGGSPFGSLTQIGDSLYGMTSQGGANSHGVIFAIHKNGTGYKKLIDFDGTNGSNPQGSLTLVGDSLYGVTANGGTNEMGVIFKVHKNGSSFQKLLDFTDTLGSYPYGSLALLGDKLYGMAYSGGLGNYGAIFKINIDGSGIQKLLDFNGTGNGRTPVGSLTVVGDSLYGMTQFGGDSLRGVLFKIYKDGKRYKRLMNFGGIYNGGNPLSALTLLGNKLYGITHAGGINDMGSIFKINPDGTGYIKLLDCYKGIQGSYPGDLVADNTYLYGMTTYGGNYGQGVIYKIKKDGTGYQNLFTFNNKNGAQPLGGLTIVGDSLYGMTNAGGGGSNAGGVIFKIHKNGTGFQKLIDMSYSSTGIESQCSLILTGDSLYGTAPNGGVHNSGTIFRIHKNGKGFYKLFDFNNSSTGMYPYGSLTLVGDSLFGMTMQGGANGNGIIFKIHKKGTGFKDIHDFNQSTDGAYPSGSLILVGDSLYGMTAFGGSHSHGCIFKINKNGVGFQKVFDFSGTDGAVPSGSLTQVGDYLYGLTSQMDYGFGTFFKYSYKNGSFELLKEFDCINSGDDPLGTLFYDGNSLYGTTPRGGTDGMGVIFKFRPDATIQASNLLFNIVIPTQADIYFTKGNGDARAVFISLDTTGMPTVINNTTYIANSVFGLGSQAGSGWYCIANGTLTNNTISLSGLTADTSYKVMVIEYTGDSAAERYLTTFGTGNPAVFFAHAKMSQTITFNSFPFKQYGDIDFNPGATASSGLPISYCSSDSGVAKIIDDKIHILGAGISLITASQAGNSIYNKADDAMHMLTVGHAMLTVTAENKTRKVGENNPIFTAIYSGWIGADDISVIDTKPDITCSATISSPAGNYDINVTGGSDNNYSFNCVKGTLTVEPNIGILKSIGNGLEIYPVPAKGNIYIKLPEGKNSIIQLLNMQGQVVLQKQLNATIDNIDVSNLVKGIYIVKLNQNNIEIIRKIEIQ